MALEIEHKYLVKNDSYLHMAESSSQIYQGYLSREPDRTIRIRIRDNQGYLTVKGRNSGAVRLEFEYNIPLQDAKELLGLCIPPILEKIRYIVPFEGNKWEVDEFKGEKQGLVVAEVELNSPDQIYELPPFVGEDVTGNPSYYNSNL